MAKRVAECALHLLGNRAKRPSLPHEEPSSSPSSSKEDDSNQSFYDSECVLTTATSGGPGLLATATPPAPPPAPLFPLASTPVPAADLVHAAAADQGGRPYMEDAHAACKFGRGAAAYACFDGHGGPFVANYCAEHLLARFGRALAAAGNSNGQSHAAPSATAAAPASSSAGGAAPAGLLQQTGAEGAAVASSLRAAFAAVDSELLQLPGQEAHMCGTTAAVCVVTDDWIYTANCGEGAGGMWGQYGWGWRWATDRTAG
jgi:hypothetical protein